MYIALQHLLNLTLILQHFCSYIFHVSTKRVLFLQQHFYKHTFTKTTKQETKESYKEKGQVFSCL